MNLHISNCQRNQEAGLTLPFLSSSTHLHIHLFSGSCNFSSDRIHPCLSLGPYAEQSNHNNYLYLLQGFGFLGCFSSVSFKKQPDLEKPHGVLGLECELAVGRVPGRRLGKGVGPEWKK